MSGVERKKIEKRYSSRHSCGGPGVTEDDRTQSRTKIATIPPETTRIGPNQKKKSPEVNNNDDTFAIARTYIQRMS